jgi:formylglycine-generating enzyme required for sulfatase activity
MSVTEVTQELFEEVMGINPSQFYAVPVYGEVQKKRPVENVNYYAVIAFCNKLSIRCGLEPVYSVSGVNWNTLTFADIPIVLSYNAVWDAAACDFTKTGFRMPTTMEWMWAAMGAANGGAGVRTQGYKKAFAGQGLGGAARDYAWFPREANERSHQVGLKKPNEMGLYDMAGNISEYAWNWWADIPHTDLLDYPGAPAGTRHPILGGACHSDLRYLAVGYISDHNAPFNSLGQGIRLVRKY